MTERWVAVVVALTVMVAVMIAIVTLVGVGAALTGGAIRGVPAVTPGWVRVVVPRARGPPWPGR